LHALAGRLHHVDDVHLLLGIDPEVGAACPAPVVVAGRAGIGCQAAVGANTEAQPELVTRPKQVVGTAANHIAHIVTEMNKRAAKGVEPTPEAEDARVKLVTSPTFMTAYQDVCTPGYYNSEGKNEGQGFLAQYPDGAVKFYTMLASWRDEGKMEGLIIEKE